MALSLQHPTELAIDRTPVEIWSRILALAISCPLLPSDDDSLIANLYLLQYDCEAIATYWDSERFRLACRLVCRSWRSLLDRYAHRLFLPAGLTLPLPFYQRIQLDPHVIQWAPCLKHQTHGHNGQPTCPVRNGHHPNNLAIGGSDPDNVQVFVDQINVSTRPVVELALTFPRLQVLCLRAFVGLWDRPVSLPTLSAKCTSLTHLALYLFFQMVEGESQVLALPNLHTLFIHLITGNWDEIRPVPLSKWRLPRLRNLGVRANLTKDEKGTYEELQLLIRSVGGGLKGLSFVWRPGPYEESLSHLIWGWCPQLQYLEMSIHSICALWPTPDTHAQLVIIIMDLKKQFLSTDLVAYGDFLTQITSIRTERMHSFGMPISWSALRRHLERATMLSRRVGPRPFLSLFECFQSPGYTFVDRYGVNIEAEEAKEVMNWLKEKYGSVPGVVDPFDKF